MKPELHPDAPPVPQGLQPKTGVEYGCGEASCSLCYEPETRKLDTPHGEIEVSWK